MSYHFGSWSLRWRCLLARIWEEYVADDASHLEAPSFAIFSILEYWQYSAALCASFCCYFLGTSCQLRKRQTRKSPRIETCTAFDGSFDSHQLQSTYHSLFQEPNCCISLYIVRLRASSFQIADNIFLVVEPTDEFIPLNCTNWSSKSSFRRLHKYTPLSHTWYSILRSAK